MKKVVGFGDFLLRLNPEGYLRFAQATRFEANYTGAEANVCVSLSMMGVPTEFVTRLPDHDIARRGLGELHRFGVGTRFVCFGGERMGVFYLEKGASQRPSRIIYDRKHTSVATSGPDDFNWHDIFADAGYFHLTGITPALSETMPAICKEACQTARRQGLTISCDLNYRKNLWTPEQAKKTMEQLLPYVDILIANEEDSEKVLGIQAKNTDITAGKLNRDGYAGLAAQIALKYGIKLVAITLRTSISASENGWNGMLYTNGQAFFSRDYLIHLVDRVGGGDSFAAGLIYGLGHGFEPQRTIDFAVAASCLKQSIELDFNLSTVEEIEKLMEGDGSGRVQR